MRIKLISFVICTILSVVSQNTFAQGLTISSGTTVSLGSATLTLSGNWANSGTFNPGSGTVIFAGTSGNQTITNASGETFNNVTVNKAAGDVRLANNITVSGTLTCTNGDLDLNGHVVTLTGTLNESAGNTVKGTSGYITCTSNLTAPSASNPHGIGIAITSAANLGSTTINRGHAAQTGEGNAGILRYFTIAPSNNASLNATLGFNYDESELNSISESDLTAFRSDDGGSSWAKISGSTLNSGANTVSFGSQSTLSRFTLASGSNPLSDDPMPEMIVIGNGNEIVDGDAVPGASKHTAFGTININSTVVRTFTIENTGEAPLTLSGSPRVVVGGTHTSDFIVTTQPPPASVGASSSTTFQVTFEPTAVGRRTATISIENNDSDENPYNFAIHGTCTLGPEMVVSGNGNEITDGDASPSLSDHTDFGSADVSSGTVVRTFTIGNTGDEALTLETSETARVVVSGTHASDFTVTTQPPVSSVGISGNTTFQVTFDPSAAGTRSATLSIANNDSNENPYNFEIQGTGEVTPVPEIAVKGNGQLIPDGDILADVADGTNFGSADVNSGTVVRTFTIENSGSAALTLETSETARVVVSGTHASDFTVTTQPPVASVGASGSTTFQVTFDPNASGTRSASISIPNNDSDENPYNFVIQGTGTTPVPEIAVLGNGQEIASGDLYPSTTDHTDFGSVNVTSGTIVRTFTIENSGTGDIHLQSTESLRVVVNGPDASDFTVSTPPSELITAGNSTTFQVTFNPTVTGLRTVTLSISNNDGDENPYIFNIQGTGTTNPTPTVPEIVIKGNGLNIPDGDTSPKTADGTNFGLVDYRSGTVVRIFTIENLGTASLNLSGSPRVAISGTHASEFTVTVQPSVAYIAAGDATTFQVTFDPGALGTRTAMISVANNDSDENPYNFDIKGTGAAPEIVVKGKDQEIVDGDTSPDVSDDTDFGAADVTNGTVVKTFTVENTGDVDLSLDGSPRVAISGAHAGDFTVSAQPPVAVVSSGGGTTTFQVTFNPSGIGTRTATVSISNDDSDEDPYNFSIQGTGTTAPEMAVKGNGNEIVDGDASPSTTDHTDFGSTDVSGGTVLRTFTIENNGSGSLTLDGSPRVEIGGTHASDFTVNTQPNSPVSASGNTTFQVTFNPSAGGTRTATLSIANNDSDENPYNFSIQGTGTITPLPEIAVTGNGNEIGDGDTTPSLTDYTDFGSADVSGGTVVKTFTIENNGNANLTLDGSPRVEIGGAHASDFTVNTQPNSPVSASGNTTFQVTFNPSAGGARTATLSIANNDSDENPYNFSIQGTGVTEAPTGAEDTVTVNEDQAYAFLESDFTFNSKDGTQFAGIRIETTETAGTLTYDGADVTAGLNCPDVTLLIFRPDANANGSAYAVFTFRVHDDQGIYSKTIYTMTVNVTAVNDPPKISSFQDRTILEDESTGWISFTVEDPDTPVEQWILWGRSTNESLVKNSNIEFKGTGNNRAVKVTPEKEQSGIVRIRVYVSDGNLETHDSFDLTIESVNDAPVISGLDAVVFDEDSSTTVDLDHFVKDEDNKPSELVWLTKVLEASSSQSGRSFAKGPSRAQNKSPLSVIIDDTSHVARFSAEPDYFGIHDVVFWVMDSLLFAARDTLMNAVPDSLQNIDIDTLRIAYADYLPRIGMDTCKVIINPINDVPKFVAGLDPIRLEAGKTYSLAVVMLDLLVDDPDNADSTLIWSVEENTHLKPILANKTITLTAPTDWQGTDTVSVMVSDGELTAAMPVIVTVFSNVDTTPPDVPVNLAAIPFEGRIRLTWDLNTESDIKTYKLFRTTDSTEVNESHLLALIEHPEKTCSDSTASQGIEYYYWLSATDSSGNESKRCHFICAMITETAAVERTGNNPVTFFLSENYPNPFNPETNITYGVKVPCRVVLKVFDLRGREVSCLVNENQQPGQYTVRFDAGHLASGVYIYRIRMKDFVGMKKMVLLE